MTDVSYKNIRRNYYKYRLYETSFIRNVWNSYTKRLILLYETSGIRTVWHSIFYHRITYFVYINQKCSKITIIFLYIFSFICIYVAQQNN